METILNQIDEMAFALDSRGFQPQQKRDSLPYTLRDLALIGIIVILGVIGRYGIYGIKG
jgi:energy-coupling factor transporter transmembrane protein EcfT